MRSGRLDRLITIQVKTSTEDSFGEMIETWATLAEVWAELKYLRGSEWFAAQQEGASVDVIFRIRYRDDVTPLNVIVYDSRTYDISAVLELGRREGLELYASARAE